MQIYSHQHREREEYVKFVITEVLKDNPEQVYMSEEEEEIKERLRRLGYIQ